MGVDAGFMKEENSIELIAGILHDTIELQAGEAYISADRISPYIQFFITGRPTVMKRFAQTHQRAIVAVMKLNFGMDVAEWGTDQAGQAIRRINGNMIEFEAEIIPSNTAISKEDIIIVPRYLHEHRSL